MSLASHLDKTISIISSSLELLFDRFSKKSFRIKSVNVIMMWPRNKYLLVGLFIYILDSSTNNLVPLTETTESNSLNNNLFIFSGENLVDTTLSILKLFFLSFIIPYLNGDHVTTLNINHT